MNHRTITLDQLYEHINKTLRGSGISNETVTIKARVKLPDEERIVDLKVIGVSMVSTPIEEAVRNRMSGMYPPTKAAVISIDCETIKE